MASFRNITNIILAYTIIITITLFQFNTCNSVGITSEGWTKEIAEDISDIRLAISAAEDIIDLINEGIPCKRNNQDHVSESTDNAHYIKPKQILSKTTKHFEGFTKDTWINLKPLLHPTQPDIGYAWAIRKVLSNFNSAEMAQNSMNPIWSDKWPDLDATDFDEISATIPCIIGPLGTDTNELTFYVIDSHHTLSALDYSGYDETVVYINVMHDFRKIDYNTFVSIMTDESYDFLLSQHGTKKQTPTKINFCDLPKTFDFNRNKKTLGDNPWRSLAGYSRKVEVAPNGFPECVADNGDSMYCMRPWIRICNVDGLGIPFYEFMWAYFYVDASYINTQYWEGTAGENARNIFIELYEQLLSKYYDFNGMWIDVDVENIEELVKDWLTVASKLVPLARGYMTGYYELDYFERDTLPGYVQGTAKIDDDSICQL